MTNISRKSLAKAMFIVDMEIENISIADLTTEELEDRERKMDSMLLGRFMNEYMRKAQQVLVLLNEE